MTLKVIYLKPGHFQIGLGLHRAHGACLFLGWCGLMVNL